MYKTHQAVDVSGPERPSSLVKRRPVNRRRRSDPPARSSFRRSTVNSQILTIDSIHDSGDARPLKKGRGFVCALILSLVGLVAGTPLLAQYDSAQINGTVRDQSGALIPNATVQVQNRDTGLVRQTVTNSSGIYVLSQIPPGSYTITAS